MRLILLSLLFSLLLGGCSLPRIIVLNDPLNAAQHNDLGVAYQQRGEFDLALREYDRAAELASDWPQPLINRGNALAAQQLWQQAAADYRKALKRDPQQAEAMNNLAWVLLQGGEQEAALDWVEQALELDPTQPAYLDTLAEIQILRKAFPEARKAIEQALALNPSSQLRASLEGKRVQLAE
jgi:tetratricopeptide (TPR) repeat protein